MKIERWVKSTHFSYFSYSLLMPDRISNTQKYMNTIIDILKLVVVDAK